MSPRDELACHAAMPFLPYSNWKRTAWKIAQAANVVALVVLIAGLLFRPETSLRVLWNILIPVLPASFLIAPHLWRGICPLATLNQWSSGLFSRRQLGGRFLVVANTIGIVLLLFLVPARRFVFNETGPALGATIALVGTAAVVLGAFFDGRAGFCNAICPVLPVERIYGQHPFWKLDNHRCDRCTLCIPKGCVELSPEKSLGFAVSSTTSPFRWLVTPYGMLAGALPGFIVGYYTESNVTWTAAANVFLWIGLCSAASYLVACVVVWALKLSRGVGLALLAATAVVLYYWWAVPLMALALDVPPPAIVFGRGAVFVLIAFWLVRTLYHLQAQNYKVSAGAAHGSGHTARDGATIPLKLCSEPAPTQPVL